MAEVQPHSDWRAQTPAWQDLPLVVLGAFLALVILGLIQLVNNAQVPLRPQSDTITARWIPATVKHWSGPIDEMAKKYDIDPNLLAIVMTIESGGYSRANSGQATGLMQITPLTAKDIASKYLKDPVTKYNLYDPKTSIEFGAAYLSYLRDTFGTPKQGPDWTNTVELVAAGYNGGPGAAADLEYGRGLTDVQTIVYSRDAFNMWRERNAKSSPTYDRWLERGGTKLIDEAKAEQQ